MATLIFRKAIFSDLEVIISLLADDDLGRKRENTAVDSVKGAERGRACDPAI